VVRLPRTQSDRLPPPTLRCHLELVERSRHHRPPGSRFTGILA
jgi:hypothetical protein